MAKRAAPNSLDAAKKFKGHWSQGLVSSMNDPELCVQSDEELVVIKDKYPKAKHHFLILPREEISSLKQLKKEHLSLLKHMDSTAVEICKKYSESKFNLGYHAVPSMARLHLHVISDDFVSDCLKTKKHWNSFTTEFFISSKDLMVQLENTGIVSQMDSTKSKELMNKPLKCHKCSFVPKNMPHLKEHLKTKH